MASLIYPSKNTENNSEFLKIFPLKTKIRRVLDITVSTQHCMR